MDKIYSFKTKTNLEIGLSELGAAVNFIKFPDKKNRISDIVLTPKNHKNNPAYLGVICGRYANRIANGKFKLYGKEYILNKNDGKNTLHGGIAGLDKKVFAAKNISKNKIDFFYKSKDKEMGFPANLEIKITYKIKDNTIEINQLAKADKNTVLNLTNHTYWNLSGNYKKNILEHRLKLNSNKFLPVNKEMIPTGEILSVNKTAFDFNKESIIKEKLFAKNMKKTWSLDFADNQLKIAGGYDHYFFIKNSSKNDFIKAVELYDDFSKIKLTISTNQKGFQLYTGNFLSKTDGKRKTYEKYDGIAIETGLPADCPNQKKFPTALLKKNEIYLHKTKWELEIK
jgi:aldose 1-epimerase